jgi:hypothetical protein
MANLVDNWKKMSAIFLTAYALLILMLAHAQTTHRKGSAFMSYKSLMMAGYEGYIRKCHSLKIFRYLKTTKNRNKEMNDPIGI